MDEIGADAHARALVLQFGWNTTAYQILNPGFLLWFSRRYRAVVGYVRWSKRRVVAGAPICAVSHLADVAAEFEADAAGMGERVVYFGAESRLDALYRGAATHSMVILGAQPSWSPERWTSTVQHHASLRAQLHRARNKGVSVKQWPSGVAERHPLLQRCLDEWLRTRPLPPLHFLIEPDTLGRLGDRKIFVAMREDRPVGFLVASPIPARRGWLTEQFVRGDGATNGTAELMIDTAIRWMAERGAEYVTLGLAPLSNRTAVSIEVHPAWLRFLFRWTHAHGRRFYNFDGLDAFKAKFRPERWEPVFAISNEPRFSVRSLHAIAAAFTHGAPARTVARGLGRAMRQELVWLMD
jgi:phosphatidylglycerol lysyltransferase